MGIFRPVICLRVWSAALVPKTAAEEGVDKLRKEVIDDQRGINGACRRWGLHQNIDRGFNGSSISSRAVSTCTVHH